MRNFVSSMLGSLVALVIFSLGLVFCGLVAIAVIAAIGQKSPVSVEHGAYLVFDLETNITDAPPRFDLSEITGGRSETLQLRTATRALRAAARDDRIAGVLITGSLSPAGFGTGYGALKEVRAALQEVRAAGKPVQAFLTFASTRDYYLASTASDLAFDPYGELMLPGLAAQPTFYAGLFEKFGIGVQVVRAGKYKSAIEPFTRQNLSPENREQLTKLLGDLWSDLLADIAADRSLSPVAIQAAVDAEGGIRPAMARDAKLIDRIAYRDQIIDELKAKTGRTGSKETFKQVALADYAKVARDFPYVAANKKNEKPGAAPKRATGRVAIVYAEGEIVDGEAEHGYVGGTDFSRELRRLRQDSDVKAIVLRINSPGGSASASETIQREIRLAREKKPVVVSMGSYAASGGYWIAAYGTRIFAEPSTITGSIGVFGLMFDVQKLASSLGGTFDSVKTGKYADMATLARPKTDEELALIRRTIDWIYDEFVDKVAEGRHLDRAAVEAIAQGRVWSGAEALKLGLVDEIGGLDAAVHYAARRAGLGDQPRVSEFPRKKEFAEVLAEWLEETPSLGMYSHSSAGRLAERFERELAMLRAFDDPRGLYARLPLEIFVR